MPVPNLFFPERLERFRFLDLPRILLGTMMEWSEVKSSFPCFVEHDGLRRWSASGIEESHDVMLERYPKCFCFLASPVSRML
jgi:hypothetical protein